MLVGLELFENPGRLLSNADTVEIALEDEAGEALNSEESDEAAEGVPCFTPSSGR
jgi:hypothetical protein